MTIDDIDELVSLVKNDADLIKMSAFKKLQLMYKVKFLLTILYTDGVNYKFL